MYLRCCKPIVICLVLFGCLACNGSGGGSAVDKDPGNQPDDVQVEILPAGDFLIHSGLIDGGVGLQKSQRITGALTDPSPPEIFVQEIQSEDDFFNGTAELTVNGNVIPLTVQKSNTVQAQAISPSSPGNVIWTFETDFELTAGENVMAIDVYDADGVHRASTGEWKATGALVSEGRNLDVIVAPPDLDDFPRVNLTVMVTDPANNNAHVPGLAAENFTVIVAGLPIAPVTVAELSGAYALSFTDIACGHREIYVHVLSSDPESFTVLSGLSVPAAYGTSYAVLTGIADYPGFLNDLDYPADDAHDLFNALTASPMWPAENVTLLTNRHATKDAVLGAIDACIAAMKPYDCLLFFFSGHGATGGDENTQYICTYENANWISVSDLDAHLAEIPLPGGSLVNGFVLLDACHSSNFIARKLRPGLTPKNRPFVPQQASTPPTMRKSGLTFAKSLKGVDDANILVMTAVTGDQSAWDDWELENGVFTYYLVEGLTCIPRTLLSACVNPIGLPAAPANNNHDIWITGGEAFDWLDERVRSWVTEEQSFPEGETQEPQLKGGDAAARFFD